MRQALAYAVDRNKASTIGEYGYEPASNQDGHRHARRSRAGSRSQAKSNDATSTTPARQTPLLEGDGYHKGSATASTCRRRGKRLSFHVINVGGNSDWVAALQAVAQGAKAAGIELIVDNLSSQRLRQQAVQRPVRPRLLRRDRWSLAVLRTAPVALLGQLRADRPAGVVELRALQRPADRRAARLVRRRRPTRPAAPDHRRAGAGHADPGADHPGHRGSRLVPVRHVEVLRMADAANAVRDAGARTSSRTGARCCSHLSPT